MPYGRFWCVGTVLFCPLLTCILFWTNYFVSLRSVVDLKGVYGLHRVGNFVLKNPSLFYKWSETHWTSGRHAQTQLYLILLHLFCLGFPLTAHGEVIIFDLSFKILLLFFVCLIWVNNMWSKDNIFVFRIFPIYSYILIYMFFQVLSFSFYILFRLESGGNLDSYLFLDPSLFPPPSLQPPPLQKKNWVFISLALMYCMHNGVYPVKY